MESDEPVGIPTDAVDTADDLVSVNVAGADSNGASDHLAALKQALQRQQQMFESFMGQQSEVRSLMQSVLKTNPAPLLQRTTDKDPNTVQLDRERRELKTYGYCHHGYNQRSR
ncbi:hypothetical protein RN001_000933 [Aquatica leii]|uniref:Uncharacterized protein n=1 Tax=Aquatica leii TaxID=1421715 RepID=A0AAN7Q7J3_9COLE|nr:hypothetical protein RN001_000933 [Aquatica leii]